MMSILIAVVTHVEALWATHTASLPLLKQALLARTFLKTFNYIRGRGLEYLYRKPASLKK
jgi:hypothetical protein